MTSVVTSIHNFKQESLFRIKACRGVAFCEAGASLGPLHLSRVLYKSTLFMQNKPNFQDAQMNVIIYYTKVYKNETAFRRVKNKPNSNPIKPNFRKAQMNVSSLITKDYRKKDDFVVRINKPNSNPISSKAKMNVNFYLQKDYENKTAPRLQKNKPKQSQYIGNELKSPISPKLTKCPIYKRSYLYYATADLINAGTVTLAQIWNFSIFHSIISHRNTSLTSDSPMPEITKTDE